MKRNIIILIILLLCHSAYTQQKKTDSVRLQHSATDSLYIAAVEQQGRPKVLHAEPLYIDLIRDLGARKGEKEWNVGMGMVDNLGYDEIEMLIEYEFAPADRLGLEIELPFTFYSPQKGNSQSSLPSDALNSLKLAGQWTFLVSGKANTSMALGYIHEFTMGPFRSFGKPLFNGNVFNPFFIAAKRWGQHFHTLVYAGPRVERTNQHHETSFDINSNIHYMIPGTRNFIGIELNKNILPHDFDMVVRPQMRVAIAGNLLVGIVGGIPVKRENQRFSMFTRLIWEPSHKKPKHDR